MIVEHCPNYGHVPEDWVQHDSLPIYLNWGIVPTLNKIKWLKIHTICTFNQSNTFHCILQYDHVW